jgi:SAM-dependent methyltransferase
VNGKRHHIASPQVAEWIDADLSKTEALPYNDVFAYPLSFPYRDTRRGKPHEHFTQPISNMGMVRQMFAQHVTGTGLEFGAGPNPFPLLPDCEVEYCDLFDDDEGCKPGYGNVEFVNIDHKTSMDTFEGITRTDYDFILSSHSIEHTPEPMKFLKLSYEHLRNGGILWLAIPHKGYTFDVYRDETTLSHFVQDYHKYDVKNDVLHVIEYFTLAHNKYAGGNADPNERAQTFLSGSRNFFDLHWHTFTPNNFRKLILWFDENVYHWSEIYIFDVLELENGSNEFYVKLIK